MKNVDIERLNKVIKAIDNTDITRMSGGELILFKNTVYMALLDIRDDDCGFTFDDNMETLNRFVNYDKIMI